MHQLAGVLMNGWLAVSRSEAQQQKRFLVLDSQWRLEDTVLLDIGPRHYSVQASDEGPVNIPDVRPGDR